MENLCVPLGTHILSLYNIDNRLSKSHTKQIPKLVNIFGILTIFPITELHVHFEMDL